MAPSDRPSGDLTGTITIAAVVAAIACCAIPLLIAAGVVTASGLALGSWALGGLGAALAVWLVVQAVRRARQRPDQDRDTGSPQASHASERQRPPGTE